LADGTDATPEEYSAALKGLEEEPDVDLMLAAVQDFSEVAKVTQDGVKVADEAGSLKMESPALYL
jgi:hypothetical protein